MNMDGLRRSYKGHPASSSSYSSPSTSSSRLREGFLLGFLGAIFAYVAFAYLGSALGITAVKNTRSDVAIDAKALLDLNAKLHAEAMHACRNETQASLSKAIYANAFDKLIEQVATIHAGYFDGLSALLTSPEAKVSIGNAKEASAGAFQKLHGSFHKIASALASKQESTLIANTKDIVESMQKVNEKLKDAVAKLMSAS